MIIFCPKWVFLSNLNEGDSVSKKEVNFEYYSVTRTQCMTVPNSSNPFEVQVINSINQIMNYYSD